MDFWENFWSVIWWFVWVFAFTTYLIAVFMIIGDIFRDHSLNGWLKAVWMIFLIFVPFLTALIYLIARGSSMTERSAERARLNQEYTESYIRDVAATSPSEEISKAKALLDSGTITESDYAKIKTRVLA
jgi:voltage-gated potassium channel Kch